MEEFVIMNISVKVKSLQVKQMKNNYTHTQKTPTKDASLLGQNI